MRNAWIFSLVALTASARPLNNDPSPKVMPNDVNILGGDFGLANTRLKIELYDMFSKWMVLPSSAAPPGQTGLAGVLSTVFGMAGMAPDSMLDWLSRQFSFWMVGTDSDEPNTFICNAFDPGSMMSGIFRNMVGGAPSKPGDKCERDYSGGSGPYKANYTVDPSLPNRTIYAPIQPPKNVAMPVIVWGGCLASGTLYANFLTEIASHGYLAIVTGRPTNATGGTAIHDMTRNVDWAVNNDSAKKYGDIDRTKIIAAGHNCGGLEALSGTYRDPRVMMSLVFNSGVAYQETREKLKQLNKPVAYFEGSPNLDTTFKNAQTDYEQIPSTIPVLFATLADVGNLGTFFLAGGGKQAKVTAAFLDWKAKGDQSKRSLFCPPASNLTANATPLHADGWSIYSKNGMC